MFSDNRPRVLVVDDLADAANSLALLLELWGYDAEVCYAGAAAVEAARSCQPEVLLLDIGMPGMNGFQVAQSLREEPGGRPAVLIAITGFAHEACRCRAQEMGFHHYLVKPVEPDDLRKLLLRIVGPLGLAPVGKAVTNGTQKGGPCWAKWLSAEIPAPAKRTAAETRSLVDSSV